MSVLRKKTFEDLLDQFFTNEKLKTSVFFPLFGNGGLPPSMMSAFIGVKVFQEFLLDGGYYPLGGMQALSDALATIFKECGGKLKLSSRINKIRVEDQRAIGVESETDGYISSKNVVSNCDARQTFLNLIGEEIIPKEFVRQLYDMEPSLSGFILYLGIDDYLNGLCSSSPNQWILSHYDMEAAYSAAKKGEFDNIAGYVIHTNPRTKTIFAFVNAPFKNNKYWEDNKERWTEVLIKRIEREVMPGLTEHILYKGAATPQTLQRYTSNYKGAAFGWASTPSQLALPDFKKPSFIRNLFLTGHWTTQGIGIPGVLYVGYDTAKMIIRKEKTCNILL
jgi:prolycopene isomerase